MPTSINFSVNASTSVRLRSLPALNVNKKGLALSDPELVEGESKGFTLIELLIVVVVLAVITLVTFLNLGRTREDANLKASHADLNSFLRTAQANAHSGFKCPSTNKPGDWWVEIVSKTYLALQCGTGAEVSSKTLTNTEVFKIVCNSTDSSLITGIIVNFSQISGAISFSGSAECGASTSSMQIILRNLNTGSQLITSIEKGGSIGTK